MAVYVGLLEEKVETLGGDLDKCEVKLKVRLSAVPPLVAGGVESVEIDGKDSGEASSYGLQSTKLEESAEDDVPNTSLDCNPERVLHFYIGDEEAGHIQAESCFKNCDEIAKKTESERPRVVTPNFDGEKGAVKDEMAKKSKRTKKVKKTKKAKALSSRNLS